jgi:hypothetical protein
MLRFVPGIQGLFPRFVPDRHNFGADVCSGKTAFPGVYCGCDGVTLKDVHFDTCSLFLAREKMQYPFAIYIQIDLIPFQCLDDDNC